MDTRLVHFFSNHHATETVPILSTKDRMGSSFVLMKWYEGIMTSVAITFMANIKTDQ